MASELITFYPFNQEDAALNAEAQRRGLIRQYKAGEIVFNCGEKADKLGMILEGQVLCTGSGELAERLETKASAGCFIGLESLQSGSVYISSAVARTPLRMIMWGSGDVRLMAADSLIFSQALARLNKGRLYQENTEVPEIDPSEPVLAVEHQHVILPAAKLVCTILITALLMWISSLVLRGSTAAAVLFDIAIVVCALFYLYRSVSGWKNEQLIITPRNIICLPRTLNADPDVIRLATIQSVQTEDLPLSSLIPVGTLIMNTFNQQLSFPMASDPEGLCALITAYRSRLISAPIQPVTQAPTAPQSAEVSAKPKQNTLPLSRSAAPSTGIDNNQEIDTEPEAAESVEFRAHWAHLVRMEIKPLILLSALLILSVNGYAGSWKIMDLRFTSPILISLFVILACWMIYAFMDWVNDRFIITEDCVKDYNRKPFAREDINIAMMQKIQSVRFKRDGIFQMLFNYGTVYILAGEGTLDFNYVPHPQKVQQMILDACARFENKRHEEEEERQHTYIADLVHTIKEMD